MENGEKWGVLVENAKEHFKIADHMAYVSLSILKENRMLIKIVSKLAEAVRELIKAFLHYEYFYKRVKLYKDPQMNLKIFIEKVAPKYLTKGDLMNIVKILKIERQHQEAPVEFVKKDKFVILMGEKYETLTVEGVREFINSVRICIARFPKSEEQVNKNI